MDDADVAIGSWMLKDMVDALKNTRISQPPPNAAVRMMF
jgi:hypothetical protein